MPITYHEDPATRTAELSVNGRITRSDFDTLAPKFEAFAETYGPIRLIEIVESLGGFDPSLIWKGLKLDFRVIPRISHCAVVGDAPWLSPLTRASGAVLPVKLRAFPMAELAAARAWIAAAD
ncbi:MAG: STAS/SEC14 domain-containing protein [Rhodobacteraceae bacterium]|nr:STAS/SEC14 domain-containing protein [Paracoccaceae bacterium]